MLSRSIHSNSHSDICDGSKIYHNFPNPLFLAGWGFAFPKTSYKKEGAASVECLEKQLKLPLSEIILFYFSTIFYRKIILFSFSTMLFRKHSCGKASFCSPHHIPDTLASSSSSASPGYRQASGWPRHEAFPMPPR